MQYVQMNFQKITSEGKSQVNKHIWLQNNLGGNYGISENCNDMMAGSPCEDAEEERDKPKKVKQLRWDQFESYKSDLAIILVIRKAG